LNYEWNWRIICLELPKLSVKKLQACWLYKKLNLLVYFDRQFGVVESVLTVNHEIVVAVKL
jgi:hypothetical protein